MEPAPNRNHPRHARPLNVRIDGAYQPGESGLSIVRLIGERKTMTTRNQCQFWDCNKTIRQGHFLCPTHYPGYQAKTINQCPSCERYKDAQYDVCLDCKLQTSSAREPDSSAVLLGSVNSHEALLEELRLLRRTLANAGSLQDYMVFNDDTLKEMSEKCPTTSEAMLAINGVGQVKLGRYGSDFLRVIRRYAATNSATRNGRPPTRSGNVQRDNREFPADKEADRFFVYVLLMKDGQYYIGQTREILERLHEHRNNMSASTKGSEPKFQWFTTVPTRNDAADLEELLQKLNSDPVGRREINRLVVDFKNLVAELDYEPHQSTSQSSIQERPMPYGGVTPPPSRRLR